MIKCRTLAEAHAVKDVIHIVSGAEIIAYQRGDTLPSYCLTGPSSTQEPVDIDALAARVAMLENKLGL